MRVISARLHRTLDIVTVVAFAVAPFVLNLAGFAATLAYLLAGVHLVLTLLTRFPGGSARPVPMAVHGSIELVVGIALVALPWVLGWVGTARLFYMAAGVVILGVWALSEYRGARPVAEGSDEELHSDFQAPGSE